MPADRLRRRVAVDALRGRVPAGDRPLKRLADDRVIGRFDDRRQMSDLRLRELALGDVADRRRDQHPAGGLQPAQADLRRKLAPVLAAGDQIKPDTHRRVSAPAVNISRRDRMAFSQPLGHQHLHPLADQLLAPIAKQRLGRRVEQAPSSRTDRRPRSREPPISSNPRRTTASSRSLSNARSFALTPASRSATRPISVTGSQAHVRETTASRRGQSAQIACRVAVPWASARACWPSSAALRR